jgi:FMN phosphatase YigB (HAD superfamily)
MPFVMRDKSGSIQAIFREQAPDAQEYLPPDNPQVRDFVRSSTSSDGGPAEMSRSDFEMIRVYEDLIDILVSKRIVVLTDFPPVAQAKLVRRKRLRTSFSSIAEVLAPDDDPGLP